jgi:Putative adhesin
MPDWTVSEPQNIEFNGDIGTVDVKIATGRLSVVGTDGPPRIEISKMGTVPLLLALDGGTLTIRQEPQHGWPGLLEPLWWWFNGGRKSSTDVSIAVPYDAVCRLWLASGSLVVSTVHADVSADCVSGRVTLLGLDGRIRSKVVSGPIEALGCAGELDLDTVNGEIVLADSASTRVRAKTVSGSLTADLDNPPYDSDIDLQTVSGEITIRVREDSDVTVRIKATNGRVTTDFPGLIVEGAWGGGSVSGKLGSGVGQLRATAVGGNIALLRRPVDAAFGDDFGAGEADAS